MHECFLLYDLDQQVYYMDSSSFVYWGECCNKLHYKPMSQPLPKPPFILPFMGYSLPGSASCTFICVCGINRMPFVWTFFRTMLWMSPRAVASVNSVVKG